MFAGLAVPATVVVRSGFSTQKRIVKESGEWYSRLARSNALDFDPGE